jgi:hypothetical protein
VAVAGKDRLLLRMTSSFPACSGLGLAWLGHTVTPIYTIRYYGSSNSPKPSGVVEKFAEGGVLYKKKKNGKPG